jgi:hypothetical protein
MLTIQVICTIGITKPYPIVWMNLLLLKLVLELSGIVNRGTINPSILLVKNVIGQRENGVNHDMSLTVKNM